MSRLSALAAMIFTAAAMLPPTTPVMAADFIQDYADNGGICGYPAVLNTIERRFRYQVAHVPNLPDVEITEFYRIYEQRFLDTREDRPIARRYCGATVRLSDGRNRAIRYLIEYGMGFASIGDNVEFCVAGFDRWMVYNGHCRVLR